MDLHLIAGWLPRKHALQISNLHGRIKQAPRLYRLQGSPVGVFGTGYGEGADLRICWQMGPDDGLEPARLLTRDERAHSY